MARGKERRVTDDLSLALAGIDAALSVLGDVREDEKTFLNVIKKAREAHDEAHAALVKIKRAAEQI